MISDLLSFGLDIVILVCLGITIFFAIRLSSSINKLRAGREEFLQLMQDLGNNIIAAEEATSQLKQASLATGEQLRRKVREGQHLHDELEIMIETAGNIADRLEKSAETASEAAQSAQKKTLKKPPKNKEDEASDWVMTESESPKGADKIEEDIPSFFIRDDEPETQFEDDAESKGRSKAEKELYEALKKNKKGRKAG